MHHHRRKSGHGSANASATDVRKVVTATDPARLKRPATMTRRVTPQGSTRKSSSYRERDWQEDHFEEERESFPQYCMICEKQFVPIDDKFLYCSETCRKVDQNSSSHPSSSRGHGSGNYPFYSAGNPEPRDIIPRASPSRPNSMHFSPPVTPGTGGLHHTSAISALRSLSIRPPSPPSPTTNPSLWPFTRSAATSPSTSYTRNTGFYSSTYDGGYAAGGYPYNYSSSGMERPLPSRRPGAYSRPKSIELVTPMVGR